MASPNELEQKITSLTKKQPRQLKAVDYFEVKKKKALLLQAANVVAVSISSINPITIVAGNKSVLTINGSGFGSTMGTVRFQDADAGGFLTINALETQIISWTDTTIKVEVPGRAGTGNVQVETSTVTTVQSSSTLTISFALSVVQFAHPNFANGKKVEYRVHHVGQAKASNWSDIGDFDNGAYLFKYNNDFASNTDAKTAFEKAFNLYVCSGGANLKLSTQTIAAKEAQDNYNSISFSPLFGLNGKVRQYQKGGSDGNGGMYWYFYEMDYVFDSNTSWSYDSSTTTISQLDFEAVARHETGHASGLGHIIDAQEIMHYTGVYGPNQQSSTNAFTHIKNKISYDKTIQPIFSMTKTDFSDCYKQGLENEEHSLIPFRVYPNPASNTLNISGQKAIEKASVYNITGALVYEATTDDGLDTSLVSINVGSFMRGVYFVQVDAGETSRSYRFIKE